MPHLAVAALAVLGCLAAALPASSPPQGAQDQRPPPPDAATIARVRTAVLRAFERPASRDTAGLLEWSRRLLEEGRNTGGNTQHECYVMLELALEGAIHGRSPAAASAALQELGRFAIDAPARKYAAAVQLADRGDCPAPDLIALLLEAGHEVVEQSPELARRALLEAELQFDRCGPAAAGDGAAQAIEALRADVFERMRERTAARGRRPVPDAAAREQVRAELDKQLKGIGRKTLAQRRQTATDLFRAGQAFAEHDDAARFERLEAAIRLAEDMPDTVLVRRAIEALALQFEVDFGERVLASGRRIQEGGRFGSKALALLFLEAAAQSVPDRLETAAAALAEAQALSTRRNLTSSDFDEMKERCADMAGTIGFLRRSAELRQQLAKTPDDRKAAFELGWLLCTRAERWDEGLPLLVQSNQFPVWLTAKKDLDGPEELGQILEVARAWWDLAEAKERTKDERRALRLRARLWYQKAEPLAAGRDAVEVKKYLLETEPKPAAPGAVRQPPEQRPPAPPPAPPLGSDALSLGLEWLRLHQDDDGHWDSDAFMKHDTEDKPCDGPGNGSQDLGVTGLALLAFMAAGSGPDKGRHQAEITRGLGWFERLQVGDNGLIGTNAAHDFIYGHAIATLALVRGYALSRDERWGRAAQRALYYLESHRNTGAVWRYQPRDGDNDTCVTSWCLSAYAEARDAGLEVNPEAFECAATFLEAVSDPSGRHGYCKQGEQSSRQPGDHGTRFPVDQTEAMTAAGLACRMVLGQDPGAPVPRAAVQLLLTRLPRWEQQAIDMYYWYYGTVALEHARRTDWRTWRRAVRQIAEDNQRKKGNARGSWDPVGAWGHEGGRVYATAMMCLVLAKTAT